MRHDVRLRASRHLLILFVAATAAPTVALSVLGWQLLRHDDDLARQQVRDRLERIGDQVVAELRADLDALEGRNDGRALPGAVLVTVDRTGKARASATLLFVPSGGDESAVDVTVWRTGQAAEDARRHSEAITIYRGLANSPDAGNRAGALVRLARAQRLAGLPHEALQTYATLAREEGALVFGDPAPLVAGLARLSLWRDLGDVAAGKKEADGVRTDLSAGRWAVGPTTFEYAWREALGAQLPGAEPLFPESYPVAAGVSALWNEWRDTHDSAAGWTGQRSAWFDGRQVTLAWSASSDYLVVQALPAQALAARWLPMWRDRGVSVEVTEPDGRALIAGSIDSARPVTRASTNTGLPWIVRLDSPYRAEDLADVVWRRRRLQLVLALATLVGVVAGFSVVRAMRRESAVARLQADFVSAVSHEFRTPLTSMSHLIELLRGRPDLDAARRGRYYEALEQETGRLRRFVDTLLDFGKTEAGARDYSMQPADLPATVAEIVARFRMDPAASGRVIEVTAEPGLPLVAVDREAFGLVLRNLLENAVKYSPASEPVHVVLTNGAARHRVAVGVKDQGSGIPPAEHDAIFEKFVRGAAARSSGVRGTGVGLALARDIVRRHGGDIELDSAPGSGSTFVVWLPVAQEARP